LEIFNKNSTELKTKLKQLSQAGKVVALVPTMGALHSGHLTLVSEAKKCSDYVVVSIFVNPKQFERSQDFDSYPDRLENDLKLLKELQVDLVYTPNSEEFYKQPFFCEVNLPALTTKLCGATRPGHFPGVALVITKLFNQIKPDLAFFGLKDYQQYVFIKQLAKDLDLTPEVRGVDTVREGSGLALSSRNLNLNEEQRKKIAPELHKALSSIATAIKGGGDHNEIVSKAKQDLLNSGFNKVDYLEVLQDDLSDYNGDYRHARIFVAAYIDQVRLIDNIAIC